MWFASGAKAQQADVCGHTHQKQALLVLDDPLTLLEVVLSPRIQSLDPHLRFLLFLGQARVGFSRTGARCLRAAGNSSFLIAFSMVTTKSTLSIAPSSASMSFVNCRSPNVPRILVLPSQPAGPNCWSVSPWRLRKYIRHMNEAFIENSDEVLDCHGEQAFKVFEAISPRVRWCAVCSLEVEISDGVA